MKKIFPVFIFLLINMHGFSQEQSSFEKPIKRGNYIIGGDLKINYKSDVEKTTYPNNSPFTYRLNQFSINASPQIGFFLSDGFVIGISPTFQYLLIDPKSGSSSLIGYKGHTFSLGSNVFIKYYFKNSIFFQLETGYLHNWDRSREYPSGKFNSNSFSIIPSIGYAIFVNSKVSVEPKINYAFSSYNSANMESNDLETSIKRSTNGINFSMQFTIFL
jgi:hypothetical protein